MSQSLPKIKLLLCGGLGNQLFQYAYGRALSLRSGAHLELDASSLFEMDKTYMRTYELDAFCIPDEVSVLRKKPFASHVRRKVLDWQSRNRPIAERCFVQEPRPLKLYPEYADWRVQRDVTLLGYWQCLQYFKVCENTIRKDLCFRDTIHPARADLASEMREVRSVAVHVRRADYAKALDLSYHERAIAMMRERVPGARFYVFTDVADWWQTNGIQGADIQLVEASELPAIEDFKLMTCCHNFIIANSSFSWWAAWLGESKNKWIICPEKSSWDNSDTIPEAWSSIETGHE